MNLQQRIQAFSKLGIYISECISTAESNTEFLKVLRKAESQNPWFTNKNSIQAFLGISKMLEEKQLLTWIQNYIFTEKSPKTIAVIMAGNIPMVGFHDALCVLITGNNLLAKLSSKDSVFMHFLFQKLIEIEPEFDTFITIEEGFVTDFDAIITTGSNNSSRYFEYYFNSYPHIIRKHRNSIGVIIGNEDKETLQKFGSDILLYFGLGCRNISKLYIPEDFDISQIIDCFQPYETLVAHNKYMNNYEYNKSIYLVSQQPHLDNGFLLFKEDFAISSPLAVVYYEKYSNFAELQTYITMNTDVIQCIVCKDDAFNKKNIEPGDTQSPNVWDYADDIDTILFLLNL